MHYANAMGFAVAHVEDAGGIDEHAVRPRERASPRIGLGAVAALACPEHGGDEPGPEIDAANDVVLRIGHKQSAAPAGKSFGAGELRNASRPAIA